jgi:SAM-dependent methyltransferase
MTTPNVYTRRWFSTFLGRIDLGLVEREVAFLRRQLATTTPPVLDLCCGPGRHAAALSEARYRVIGLDRDAAALRDARVAAPGAMFVRGDMRYVPLEAASVGAVICMWQSFGHFDAAGNQAVLGELARVLMPNGRLVLDLYHRDFHIAHVGERLIERDGERVHEARTAVGDRLHVRLLYESSGSYEEFDWLLYTPDSLEKAGRAVGLQLRIACSEFDEGVPASDERARMQTVFERL